MLEQIITSSTSRTVAKPHYAVARGNIKVVQLLLDRGAKTDTRNLNNKKPIDLCTLLDDDTKQAIGAMLSKHSTKNTSDESEERFCNESTSTVKTFNKRQGTASVGQFYESKLLSMVLFRLRHDEQVEDFLLGNNLDAAGAFDDIVVRTIVGGRSRVLCLQAKHKQKGHYLNFNDLVGRQDTKGDFNLLKYFDSFLKIRYMFHPDSDHAIFQGEYDETEVELIIFTPATLNDSDCIQCKQTSSHSIFYTKQTGKTIKIDCTTTLLNSFIEYSLEWHRKNVEGILVKLLHAIEHDPSNVQEFIESLQTKEGVKEITNWNTSFNYSGLLQLHHNEKLLKVTDNKNVKDVKNIRDKISKFLIEPLIPSQNEHTRIVRDFFGKVRFYTEQTTENELDGIISDDIKRRGYERSDLIFPKFHDSMVHWWKQSGQVPFLSKTFNNFDAVVNEVKVDEIQSTSLKKINSNLIQFCYEKYMNTKWVNQYLDVKKEGHICMNIYSDTPELCYVKIKQYFDRRKINFKFAIVDNPHVADLLENFGKNKPNFFIVAYMPKNCENLIEKFLLKPLKIIFLTKHKYHNNLLSFKDTTESLLDLTDDSQKKILETPVTFQGSLMSVKELLDNAPKILIDAVTLQNIIKDKNPVISNVLNDQENCTEYYIDRILLDNSQQWQVPKAISEISDRFVILAAEPGMGKSTFLANSIKKSNPATWIAKINLLDYSKQFDDWTRTKPVLDENHALNFLISTLGCKNSPFELFEKELFRWHCNQNIVMLLVDGFDEICPHYLKIVLDLLEIYKHNFTTKLWVTTRTGGVLKELEKRFGVRAYLIKLFTIDESKLFLRRFWETKLKKQTILEDRFENYVRQLFAHLSKSIGYSGLELISIPLQIKMVAIIFEDNFERFCNATEEQTFFDEFNLVTLYEQFINMKLKGILMEGKQKVNTAMPNQINQINQTIQHFQKVAIFGLLNETEYTKLLNEVEIITVTDFLANVETSGETVGLITRVVDGKPKFVHQTYAEYLATLFIWEKFCSLEDFTFEDFIENCLVKMLITRERVQVAKFLQQIAQNKFKDCSNYASKAKMLLKKLTRVIPGTRKQFRNRAFSNLLGIVETSITMDCECFAIVKEIIRTMTFNNQCVLLFTASSAEYIKLVCLVTDSDFKGINYTFDWLKNWTALHFAAQIGNSEIIKLLFERGANINCITMDYSHTPLILASRTNCVSAVQTLLDLGANVHLRTTDNNFTALHWAADQNYSEIIKLLINKGRANINYTTTNGTTPLIIASQNNSVSAVQTLLDLGADVYLATFDENLTALHWAAREDKPEIIKLLIKKGGADINCTCTGGSTPLIVASQHNSVNAVQTLLDLGANVHLGASDDNFTVLHWAALKNNPEIIKLLIKQGGADINCTTTNGSTPLIEASINNSKSAVQMLLLLGANVHLGASDDNYTALHWAALKDNAEIIKLLIRKGGANINCTDKFGNTPLIEASQQSSKQAVQTLLNLGANVHLGTADGNSTALHLAAKNDKSEIIKLLIEKGGANINCTCKFDDTPLIVAAQHNSVSAVQTLLDLGANVHLGTSDGRSTALHLAARNDNSEIIKLLIKKGGANIDCTDKKGDTPLMIASRLNCVNAKKTLLDLGVKEANDGCQIL